MTKMFLKPLAASFLVSLTLFSCSAPVGPSAVSQAVQGTSEADRGLIGPTTYPSMYLRGTFNSWGSKAMTQVSNYTWETEVTFAAGGLFKFDAAADWATNFGDNNADLTADRNGSNIAVPAEGLYVIRFNDQTQVYSVTKKLLQYDLYCIPDRTVIYSDWEISGLNVQVYLANGALDRTVPVTVTTSHGSYASLRNPGILPGTYRAVVDQVVNGYRYTGETSFTLVNSSSPSPTLTITKKWAGGKADLYWTLTGQPGTPGTVLNGLTAQFFKEGQAFKTLTIDSLSYYGPWTGLTGLEAGNYQASVNQIKDGVLYQGTYFFTVSEAAPEVSQAVFVTGTSQNFQKTYPTMYLRGTFNDWGATAMTLEADYTWKATVSFAAGTGKSLKFDAYNNWSLNWGDNNGDLVADQNGANIPVSLAGTVTVRFNDKTRAFSFTAGN